jgi:hypothetical protein
MLTLNRGYKWLSTLPFHFLVSFKSLGPIAQWVKQGIAGAFVMSSFTAGAVELGLLTIERPIAQKPFILVELETSYSNENLQTTRGRIGSLEAFNAAGLKYNVLLQDVRWSIYNTADGGVFLRLDNVPLNFSVSEPSLDLLIMAANGTNISIKEYQLSNPDQQSVFRSRERGSPDRKDGKGTVVAISKPPGAVTARAKSNTAAASEPLSTVEPYITASSTRAKSDNQNLANPALSSPLRIEDFTVASVNTASGVRFTNSSTASTADSGSVAPESSSANLKHEIQLTLNQWAQAWSNKDIATYLNHYTADYPKKTFVRGGKTNSRSSWIKDRTAKISQKKSIDVKIGNIELVVVNPRAKDEVIAKFTQYYQSDRTRQTSLKQIIFVLVDRKWHIQEEKELFRTHDN